jgi:hypothetical protein
MCIAWSERNDNDVLDACNPRETRGLLPQMTISIRIDNDCLNPYLTQAHTLRARLEPL